MGRTKLFSKTTVRVLHLAFGLVAFKMLLRSLGPRSGRVLRSTLSESVRVIHASAMTSYKDAMPKEVEELMKDHGYRYLDVRTPEEFTAGHVPSAVNVPVVFPGAAGMAPNPAFLSEVQRLFPAQDSSMAVGCKSGRRSTMAVELLSKAGYSDLVNMTGGFDLWVAQGLPVEK